jgi:hypothetical protein
VNLKSRGSILEGQSGVILWGSPEYPGGSPINKSIKVKERKKESGRSAKIVEAPAVDNSSKP